MYPNYYPFQQYFYINGMNSYPMENLNFFPVNSVNVSGIQQQPNLKQQQINTNYSLSGKKEQIKKETKPAIQKQFKLNFKYEKIIEKQNKNKQRVRRKNKKNDQNKCFIKAGNKNYESNIINKVFSFLWSQDKSRVYAQKILKDKIKVNLYFDFIKIVRKYCKRYINKQYLANLCDYQMGHIAYRIVIKQVQKLKYFSMQQFSCTIRKLIRICLNQVCMCSILTSKKMKSSIWSLHFIKMRNIRQYLFQGLDSEQYDRRMIYGQKQYEGMIQKEMFGDQKIQNEKFEKNNQKQDEFVVESDEEKGEQVFDQNI